MKKILDSIGYSIIGGIGKTCGVIDSFFGDNGVGFGTGIGYGMMKGFEGLVGLGKKAFSSSGPRCPLLPFIRR